MYILLSIYIYLSNYLSFFKTEKYIIFFPLPRVGRQGRQGCVSHNELEQVSHQGIEIDAFTEIVYTGCSLDIVFFP